MKPETSKRWAFVSSVLLSSLLTVAVIICLAHFNVGSLSLGDQQRTQKAGVTAIAGSEQRPPHNFAANNQLSISAVYQRSLPGIVSIESFNTSDLLQQSSYGGTGFVIDNNGHILTNRHVIAGAETIAIRAGNQKQFTRAKLVGADPSTDIALLEAPVNYRKHLTPLPLGDSDKIQVGDAVIAIGDPFGLSFSVSAGIISALDRTISAPAGFPIHGMMQTDAAINPGNSGGPLLDAAGDVIGVNSQIESTLNSNSGVSFALPANSARSSLKRIISATK